MKLVRKVDGSLWCDGNELKGVEILSVNSIRPGKPVEVLVSNDRGEAVMMLADELVIAHSKPYDDAVRECLSSLLQR